MTLLIVALTVATLTLSVLAVDVPCNVKKSLKLAEGRAGAELLFCTTSISGFIKPATAGVAGVKSTDGSTFQVFSLQGVDLNAYRANSASPLGCGYLGCTDKVKEWRRAVPHYVALLIVCADANAGSIISANCDIEVDLVFGATVAYAPAGQCQTGLYCRDTCGAALSAGSSPADYGNCCADCLTDTSKTARQSVSPCRNSCPALGASPVLPIDARPAAARACQTPAYCLQYCGDARNNAGFGVCCAGCQGDTRDFLSITNGVCQSSCPAYRGDGSVTLAPSTTQKVITTPAPAASCDCDCIQQRCRDECGTKGVTINACSSNNGLIVEKTCQCRAAAAATPPVAVGSGVTLMINYFIIVVIIVTYVFF